jgi:pyruvate dehydrogenase E1 component alpha subunit
MSRAIAADFSVERLGILAETGEADTGLMPRLGDQDILRLYELMALTRGFDALAVSLQREGRLGTYPSGLGQEAAQVGSAYAIAKEDWIFPSFRETGVYVTAGYPMALLLSYWSGDERGMKAPPDLNLLPVCVSVASQIPHAVGAAMAARYRRDHAAVVVYFGDGASSKGDFHEALNIAGVFKAPVVFVCQNNQWAISMSRERQTAAATIAQKAIAYGFGGVQVDGNDVFAVYAATLAALEKARAGGGPSLVECATYRISHHTTSDDASRYRRPEELELWKKRDPIARLRLYMEKRGLWSDGLAARIEAEVAERTDAAAREAESMPAPEPREMLESTASALSWRQERDLGELGGA